MAICKHDGCRAKARARGWCHTHYIHHRRRKHPAIRTKPCAVAECQHPVDARGYCKNHYEVWKRGYEPGVVRPRSSGCVTSHGYARVPAHGHPVGNKRGQAYQHRIVLYDKIGPGPHVCHWCHREIYWFPESGQLKLNVDHLDQNKLNNVPENLVASCHNCNITGDRCHPQDARRSAHRWKSRNKAA